MTTIFQTTFSNVFSLMEMYAFWSIFPINNNSSMGSNNGFAPGQVIIVTNDVNLLMRHLASIS